MQDEQDMIGMVTTLFEISWSQAFQINSKGSNMM